MQPATPPSAAGRSGCPRTVTWLRPRRCAPPSSGTADTSTSIPRGVSACSRAVRTRPSVPAAAPSSTPSTSRPRITTCSTSWTVMSHVASVPSRADVTPGRSLPVTVTRRLPRAGAVMTGSRYWAARQLDPDALALAHHGDPALGHDEAAGQVLLAVDADPGLLRDDDVLVEDRVAD